MTTKLPDLDYLAGLSDEEAKAELSKLPTSDERILGEVIRQIYKVSNEDTKEELTNLSSAIWIDDNPAQGVLHALAIGAETRKIQGTIKAANARHAKNQNLYTQACGSVEMNLEADTQPEWMHIDFVNDLLKNEKFKDLSRNSLIEKVRQLFKERGLTDRIGKAKHIKK